VIPGHVVTLEDYWIWLDSLIDHSGGWLDGHALIVRPIEVEVPFADEGDPSLYGGLYIPPQTLRFADGSELRMRMVVDLELELSEYSLHYQDSKGGMIWRKCNHLGHDVGLLHIHRHPSDPERVEVFKDVDFEEVIQEVWAYIQDGTRP
jgi:hypothetical protein